MKYINNDTVGGKLNKIYFKRNESSYINISENKLTVQKKNLKNISLRSYFVVYKVNVYINSILQAYQLPIPIFMFIFLFYIYT